MRVTQRLYFAALPSVVGALAVAALAYWGQYSRVVPEIILVIAIFATFATLIMSWVNVRYVARRVERLALTGRRANVSRSVSGITHTKTPDDELDTIEGVVTQLNNAVQSATDERARDVAHHEARRRDYAGVLAMVAAAGARELDEVRLPLHILLENHFGELNENQEEMLGAARTAAEKIANELTAMAELARLELSQVTLRKDRVFPADALNAILPVIRAQANARGIQLEIDIQPLVPALQVDASRLQQSLQVLLSEAVSLMPTDAQTKLSMSGEHAAATIALSPVNELPATTSILLAKHMVRAMGGDVAQTNGALTIRLSV